MVSKGIDVPFQESQQNCDAIKGMIIVKAEFDYVQFSDEGDCADVLTMTLKDPKTGAVGYIKIGEHVHNNFEGSISHVIHPYPKPKGLWLDNLLGYLYERTDLRFKFLATLHNKVAHHIYSGKCVCYHIFN